MTADLLRRAAVKLREYAQSATQGPWGAGNGDQVVAELDQKSPGVMSYRYHVADCGSFSREDEDDEGRFNHADPDDDAEYIALMHPPVALALADWLDDAASHRRGLANAASAESVAREVLREPEPPAAVDELLKAPVTRDA